MDLLPNNTPTSMMINKKLYLVIIALVIIGGINWLIVGAAGFDPIKTYLGRKIASAIYIVVGIAAVLLALRRDVYLPFLGQTLFPAATLTAKVPQGANETVSIRTRPGAKVVYWAAESEPHSTDKNLKSWDKAYGEIENSGVVVADQSGVALLRIRGPPQAYTVPMKGKLKAHIHFRVEEAYGFFGRVQIKYLDSGVIENFANSL
jgi:uncharacterized membrane protein YuzA (DUF378 family)